MSNFPIFRPQKFTLHTPETEDEVAQVTTGLRGPIGPEGPPGDSGGFHLHEQTVLSTSWVSNHNLGYHPNVDAFDELGRRLRPAVIHHTLNQTELQFLTPRIGTANFS